MSPTPMTPYVVDGEEGKKTPTGVSSDPENIMISVDDETKEGTDQEINDDDTKNAGDDDKLCLLNGGIKNGRPAIYKRVSFGNSMVQTMVIESQEDLPFPDKNPDESSLKPPAKVRVTFYECQKPHFVSTPESGDVPVDLVNGTPVVMSSNAYPHRASTDSGVDNPFRPDGELSKEAETIVNMIKEGKPIAEEPAATRHPANGTLGSSHKPSANGTAKPGVVEVQHGLVVPPSDGSQVEQVTIKKKPKCRCCVIQ
ncbi:uncharacterized protein LOC111635282 isoform X1 [Centruroides sculpturatus]|uniref:uncharacterized protein LOC111635282 isoform X1 n=1 Tax=Centruroides sculpturatus TaxID=218467 RepID=UPI000C6DBF9F|nr:uncharacterized protein LOC111635282 isoform X1 [Centruroides sculpturatus]